MTTRLHPIEVAVPLPAGIHLGALVTYRGRRWPGEQHTLFYIAEVEDGWWLTLVDRDYPSVTVLHHVDPHVVTPTGRTVALCESCGHETGRRWNTHNINICDAHPVCACLNHDTIRDE